MKYAAQEGNHRSQNWLGELPDGWATKRLKYVSTINDETLPETTDPDYELLYVDIGSVDATEGIQKKEPMIFETAPSRARRVVQDGDTIVSTVRSYLRAVAPIRNPEENLIVSTGFAVVRPKGIDPHYLAYSLRSSYFIETVVSRSVGVSYPATNPTDVSCIELPLPPIDEQQAIARFLDAKTAQIDALVAQKRQLIAKLKEKRSALIARTVTRGLPPEAAKAVGLEPHPEMKDSGHPWLADIPAHWEVKRLKDISVLFGRIGFRGYSTEDLVYEGEGAISLSPSNMVGGALALDKCTWLSWEKYHESPEIKVAVGDVIMVKTGSTLGKVAFVGSVPTPMTINPQLMIFKEVKCSNRFLFYYLISTVIQDIIPLHNTGSTIPTMTQEGIGKLPFPCPNIEEQDAIATFLDEQTNMLDSMTAAIGVAIERLVEYRQAVITSAVTGKIDVRGLA
ncbi:restriction endonuclease subunit S [Acidithiobacillus ferrooxidans]|jgi:type I restriction enzyme S subunit|nr:restriction endonuclease subunit S [Acidithiobacillus ferrooxidans]